MTADQPIDIHEWCGAYVAEALEPDERALFEAHCDECANCRATLLHLAVLPGMIRRAMPLLASTPPTTDNATRVAATIVGIDEHRHRQALRTWRACAAGAMAAAAVAITLLIIPTGTDRLAGKPMAITADAASGDIRTVARPWGTEVRLTLNDLPTGATFVAVARDVSGAEEQIATWSATTSGKANVTGASSFATNRLSEILVRTVDGSVVARALPTPG